MSAQFPKGWRGTGLYSVCSAMILLVVMKWVIIHRSRHNDRHCEGDLNKDCF